MALVLLVIAIMIPNIVYAQEAKNSDMKSIIQGTTFYDPEANSCKEESTTPEPTTANGKFFMVGDSIGEGIKGALEEKLKAKDFSDITIDTAVSRSLTSPGQSDESGFEVIKKQADIIKEADTVVVQLGTNGATDSSNIKKTIKEINKINKEASIYWVNIGTTSKANGLPKNRTETNKDLEKETDQGYKVIDWSKEVGESDGENLLSDGVHPNDKGGKILANLIASGVANNDGASNGTVTNGGANSGVGNDKSIAAKVWVFLVSKTEIKISGYSLNGLGLSSPAAAGVMGNLEQESGFNPDIVEAQPSYAGAGYGLAQWTGPRRTSLENFASKEGKSPSNLGVQLKFLNKELDSGYQDTLKRLLKTEDLKDATWIFHGSTPNSGIPSSYGPGFERSNDSPSQIQERVDSAKKWLSKYGGKTISVEDGGSCDSKDTDSGFVSGEFAFPTDKKYWKTAKSEFTSPHHDYPAIDIGLPVPEGANVYSMTSGKIIKAPIVATDCQGCESGSYGRGVWVKYDNDVEIIYGHGKDGGEIKNAKVGDTVEPGQLIMHLGNTGHSFGAHIHLEIRYKGRSVCPQKFVEAVAEEKPVPKFSELGTEGCHT